MNLFRKNHECLVTVILCMDKTDNSAVMTISSFSQKLQNKVFAPGHFCAVLFTTITFIHCYWTERSTIYYSVLTYSILIMWLLGSIVWDLFIAFKEIFPNDSYKCNKNFIWYLLQFWLSNSIFISISIFNNLTRIDSLQHNLFNWWFLL